MSNLHEAMEKDCGGEMKDTTITIDFTASDLLAIAEVMLPLETLSEFIERAIKEVIDEQR